jgi:thiol:disulfide interchange protein DsbD
MKRGSRAESCAAPNAAALLTCASVVALASMLATVASAASATADLLPPERAFPFTARALGPQTVEARFNVADGYYLYRDKVRFQVEPAAAGLVPAELPAGKVKHDEFFGDVATYRGVLRLDLVIKSATPGQRIVIKAESQGCADAGICYPPIVQTATVTLPAGSVIPEDPAKKSWFN